MNNKVDHDQIKQYAVQIEYAEEKASGVIVKPCDDSPVCYVFTVKHTFNPDRSDKDLSKIKICLEEVVVNFPNEKIPLKLSYQLDLINHKSDDLVVFILKSEENKRLKNIRSISVVENDFTDCSITGYPAIRSGEKHNGQQEQEHYPCRYEKTNEIKKTYEVFSEKSLHSYDESEINCIKGLSGGGVFTQFNEKEYLVGIQIGIEIPENLVCLDLRKFIDPINEYLRESNLPEIQIKNLLFDRFEGINLEDVDFNKLNKIILQEDKKDKSIEILADEVKRKESELKTKYKDLADDYLLCGIMYHNKPDNRRATFCFNKAIYYHPNYKIYLYQAKELRKKTSDEEIKQVVADTKANAPSPEENHAVTAVIEKCIEENEKCIEENENKESPISLEEKYLNLLAQYDKENQKNEESLNKKLALLKKLINIHNDIHNDKRNFNTSEIFCRQGVELSKQKPNEEIWFRFQIIKVLSAQEKYADAKSYCEQTLKLRINFLSKIKIYNYLIRISSHLKGDKNEIERYYQTAKIYLEKIKHDNKLYEKWSDEVEKSWIIALSYIVGHVISSDRELKNHIDSLKKNSDFLTKNYRFIEQKIDNFEPLIKGQMDILQQQITELKNVLEFKLNQENKKDKSLKEMLLDWIRNKLRF